MTTMLNGAADLSLPDFSRPAAPPLGTTLPGTTKTKPKPRTLLQKTGSLTKAAVKPAAKVSAGIGVLNNILNPAKPTATGAPSTDGGLMSKIMSPLGLGISVAVVGGLVLVMRRKS
jgi:hypothetical protein